MDKIGVIPIPAGDQDVVLCVGEREIVPGAANVHTRADAERIMYLDRSTASVRLTEDGHQVAAAVVGIPGEGVVTNPA